MKTPCVSCYAHPVALCLGLGLGTIWHDAHMDPDRMAGGCGNVGVDTPESHVVLSLLHDSNGARACTYVVDVRSLEGFLLGLSKDSCGRLPPEQHILPSL